MIALAPETSTLPTPFFYYDGAHLAKRARQLLQFVRTDTGLPVSVHYAIKANASREVLCCLRNAGLFVDVVSFGEAECAMAAGFAARDVLFSGVAKTASEIRRALLAGVKQINAESLGELERIAKLALELKIKEPISIGLRLNPNVSPETHPYITTGLHENKFGLEEPEVREAAQMIASGQAPLRLRGLSLHIGSQLLDLGPLDEALGIALALQNELRAGGPAGRLPMDRFDAGGGIGIRYETDDETDEVETMHQYGQLLRRHLHVDAAAGRLTDVIIEPGRWLVARAGALICEVQYVKRNQHKAFVILDGGMNLLIRPALYQAHHRVAPLSGTGRASGPEAVFDIVGPICESADFLARERRLPTPREGDRLVIFDAGAYGRTMSSNYNQHGLPREYFFDGKIIKETHSP